MIHTLSLVPSASPPEPFPKRAASHHPPPRVVGSLATMDVGRCDGALVDWKFLRRELEAWSQRPTADAHLGVDPWDWGREGRGGARAGLMEEVKLSEWSGRREWIWLGDMVYFWGGC